MNELDTSIPEGAEEWHEPVTGAPVTPEKRSLRQELESDETIDAIIENPQIVSATTLKFDLPEMSG